MPFITKDTRSIGVDGQKYYWSHNHNKKWIVVRQALSRGQQLWVDPHGLDWSGSESLGEAIRFALAHGWTPKSRKAALRLRHGAAGFEIVPN